MGVLLCMQRRSNIRGGAENLHYFSLKESLMLSDMHQVYLSVTSAYHTTKARAHLCINLL